MDITPIIPQGKLIITRYGNGGFVINETRHEGNILILSTQVLAWPATEINEASLAALFGVEPLPELLLIGAGKQAGQPMPELRVLLRDKHIAMDVMDTGAACRTYNVLLAEDRRVAAALIAI